MHKLAFAIVWLIAANSVLSQAANADESITLKPALVTLDNPSQLAEVQEPLRSLLTHDGWNQPFINPSDGPYALHPLDAEFSTNAGSELQKSIVSPPFWEISPSPGVEPSWQTTWRIEPVDSQLKLPRLKYVIWAWRDGTIQFNVNSYDSTALQLSKVYRDGGLHVVRVLLVDENDGLTFIDSYPVRLAPIA